MTDALVGVRGRRTRSLVLTTVIAAGSVVMILPFYWLLIATTYPSSEIFASPPNLLPGPAFFDNLSGLLTETLFGRAIGNSVLIASVYTVLGLVVCTAAGYAFAKFEFRGRGVLFGAVLVTLALPSQVTLVPLFQIMVTLGWLDTYQALILPSLAMPFGIFLMRQTMLAVPDELLQAARVDGAGEFRVFSRIVLPTVRPAIAALAIFLFLGQWNEFVYPLVVLRTPESFTIPVSLASLQGIGTTDYGQLMTGTLLSVLPILVLFLFLQRHFVAGILAGAVKQ
ncbi:lactose/L-arabinose transport system permease protein [Agromyces cerinus]|uniref:Lactose/L-arabinose transport system permease protein n=1 Tax=Agromyces hippuratus TaxID=286438 RepID=A0A852WSC4_9MICO|nr:MULTISPECIES: carbohydrate ABC transporter permease [Agromyces]MBM7829920.1 lactose/L-arabinose transport system permease protein [Agromyces cerinus]NYG20627.1 lactose/L-arabinose transport system permease protein [Agromyces hippuratus]